MLFLSVWQAILVVVPDPRNGSSTVSPFALNMRISRVTISSGYAAIRLSDKVVLCRAGVTCQIWLNQLSRSFFEKALS